jgi:hypothetical protein
MNLPVLWIMAGFAIQVEINPMWIILSLAKHSPEERHEKPDCS